MTNAVSPERVKSPMVVYMPEPSENLGRAAAEIAIAGIVEIRQRLTDDRPALIIVPEGHVGAPPRLVDAHAHRAVERASYRVLPQASVHGEEVSKTAAFTEDELSVIADALDGTYPALIMATAYSSVAMTYEMREGHLGPLSAAIATGAGNLSVVDEDGTVAFDDLQLARMFPERAYVPWEPRTMPREIRGVANVGAKPSQWADHRLVEEVALGLDSNTAFVSNLGGTPTIDGLLGAQLSASVATKFQTPWDAAHLFIAVHAGAAAFLADESSTEVTVDNVRAVFSDPVLDNSASEAEKKTIPPFVVGWEREYVRAFATNLRSRMQETPTS